MNIPSTIYRSRRPGALHQDPPGEPGAPTNQAGCLGGDLGGFLVAGQVAEMAQALGDGRAEAGLVGAAFGGRDGVTVGAGEAVLLAETGLGLRELNPGMIARPRDCRVLFLPLPCALLALCLTSGQSSGYSI